MVSLSLLCFAALLQIAHSDYYDVKRQKDVNTTTANKLCQENFDDGHVPYKYLASVHSKDEFDSVNKKCSDTFDYVKHNNFIQ